MVAYLGDVSKEVRESVKQVAEGKRQRQRRLTDDVEPAYVEVDPERVRVERCRKIPSGQEQVAWSLMAQVLVLCRLCEPSSELHIAESFYRQSAIPDLLGVAAEKINDDRWKRAQIAAE